MRPRVTLNAAELIARLPALQDGRPIVLLVLRGDRATRRIEQATANAFAAAAARVMRERDLLAHDPGHDVFAVAMVARSREGGTPLIDARAALERIANAIAMETGRRLERGWLEIGHATIADGFETLVERALERGAREREHYEFLAAVGHELRTPLTSIRGYIETLLEHDIDAPTARLFLLTARNEALRLGRLVDGILDFSFLDVRAGTRTATDVRTAVRAAIDALEPVAREADVKLSAAVDEGFSVRLAGDACMHVLLNLIENGIKYVRCGGTIRVSAQHEGPLLHLLVDDDGPGVPEAERTRIFKLGERAATHERGKGVGLAIVRTIVERAGGRVRVLDSPLGGARFAVELPACQAETAVLSS